MSPPTGEGAPDPTGIPTGLKEKLAPTPVDVWLTHPGGKYPAVNPRSFKFIAHVES